MKNLEGRNTVVAVDPSFTNMGVAIFRAGKVVAHSTGKFQDQIKWIRSKADFKDCIFILENPNLDSKAFAASGMIMSMVDKYKVGKASKKQVSSTVAIGLAMAQKVGKSKQSAMLLIDMLKDAGIPYHEVAPSDRQKAYKEVKENNQKVKHHFEGMTLRKLKMPTKTTRAQLKYWTGGVFDERTSEHVRDAITLFHGHSLRWLKNTIIIAYKKAQAASEQNTAQETRKLFQNA